MTYTLKPDRDLVLERALPIGPGKVWAAWTTPELLTKWFTPAPWRTVACDIELRPGGRFNTTMQSPQGDKFANYGCYLQIEPGRLLVFTSAMTEGFRPVSPSNGAGDMPFTARIELSPTVGGGTHYRAIAIHPTAELARRHQEMGFQEGWSAALDQLVALYR